MRRVFLLMAVACIVALTLSGSAAAFKRGFHLDLSGPTVFGFWFGSNESLSVVVTQSQGLTLVQGVHSTFEFDGDGNVVSVTDREFSATRGFDFKLRQPLAARGTA